MSWLSVTCNPFESPFRGSVLSVPEGVLVVSER